jgi:hypothetical protein
LITVHGRSQPEFGLDQLNNVYLTAFDGQLNIKTSGEWLGEGKINSMSNYQIGFVETAGAEGFAYMIWEEGTGNAHDALDENASIFIGKLYPDGRVIGLVDND